MRGNRFSQRMRNFNRYKDNDRTKAGLSGTVGIRLVWQKRREAEAGCDWNEDVGISQKWHVVMIV